MEPWNPSLTINNMLNPFNPDMFRKIFDSYFWKWSTIAAVLYVAIFGTYTAVACGVLTSESTFAPFLSEFIASLEYSEWIGEIPIGGKEIGFLTFGAVSVGIVSIGAFSVGIVSIGAFSVGIFAFGGYSFGIFAIGGGTSLWQRGIQKAAKTKGKFNIGKAFGVIAVSPEAYGVYTLSYAGRGAYTFSPSHQDADAVAFFTRWLPKFKNAFHSST